MWDRVQQHDCFEMLESERSETWAVRRCTAQLKSAVALTGEKVLQALETTAAQPPCTGAGGPSAAWRLHTRCFSAAWKQLMPTVITLHLRSRSCFSLVIAQTLSLRCCNFCPSPALRPSDSWGPAPLPVPLAAEGGGLLCFCSAEGVPTACGMQRWECWTRGLPEGRAGEGGVEERRGGDQGGWPLSSAVRKLWLNFQLGQ